MDTLERTDPATGLTSAQVAERRAAGLGNQVDTRSSRSLAGIVRANVLTPFNALIGGLCVLVLATGDPRDALFGLIIVVNSGIGVVQEVRAKRTLDRLSVVSAAPVHVIRDGQPSAVRPDDLVRGDVVRLRAGESLVVDGVVRSADGLEIDESLLTGESDPVVKTPGDQLMSGSFAVAGAGSYVATRVGGQAYARKLASEAGRFSLASSELRRGINRFIRYITWFIVPIGVLLTWSQLTRVRKNGSGLADAISSTVAGVVTMIPEGLVLLTSMAFAVGVIRLARRRCLVQELPAVETLARVDVLCVDKTGTLTEGGLELTDVRLLEAEPAGEPAVRAALAALVHADPHPNPTLAAIRAGLATGSELEDHEPVPPVATVPFSSARKWSGAAFDDREAWVLGAPDVVLAPDEPARDQAVRLAAQGLRVLVAGTVPREALDDPDRLPAVRPAALLVVRQTLRPDAARTIAYFDDQGVAVKVISGDNAEAVGAIAAELRIPGADRTVDARELAEDLAPDQLGVRLDETTVLGRVTPHQKRMFVSALQARGHTVAMTGDGVNDVLALKDADLGIAMGSGAGATRAVAQVVLLDDAFAGLPHVVAEGRRVLGNIERVANLFLTKTWYAVLLALVVGLTGVPFPFLPRHLTLVSALTIGIPGFVLALAPNVERARPGFVPRVLRFAIPAGVSCGVATLVAYALARADAGSNLRVDRTVATLALMVVALWVLALVARPVAGSYAWWRMALVAGMGALFVAVCAVPFARRFFALDLPGVPLGLEAVGIGLAAGCLLTLGLALDGWLRRGSVSRSSRATPAGSRPSRASGDMRP